MAWPGRSSQGKGCQPVLDLPVFHEERMTNKGRVYLDGRALA